MYGRILAVEIIDAGGNSTYIVDPNQETRLMCSGTIEYLPSSSGAPRATIQVYNLPATLSSELFSSVKTFEASDGEVEELPNEKLVRVSFGYEDEDGGKLSTIFVGTIVRAFTTREDAVTSVTKIYAYQLGDFYNSAISSAQFDEGTTLYDCVKGLFDNSNFVVSYQLPDDLKNYKIDSSISFYGKTLTSVTSLLSKVNYSVVVTPLGLQIVSNSVSVGELDCVVLASYDENERVVARSGLIGFPCMDTDGMRFETLINPSIMLYSYVWLPNSIILDQRDGFVPSNQFGATFDPAGIYRVVKMTTVFDSQAGSCKTSYIALAAGTSSVYYK